MTAGDPRWARIDELFRAAATLPRSQWRSYLELHCGGDAALFEEVVSLLGRLGAEDPDTFLSRARIAVAGAPAAPDKDPEQIGPYRILETLGEGGMGTVYLAEQRQPVHRRVALKIVKLGMDSKAVLARFDAERQALSMMEHTAVARIFDAGLTDQGRPYFAMEYVKGVPITDYCDRNKLPIAERIDLFRQVCSGVQHAHLKGVMHRDLKPGNVLVTLQDGKPTPKIIDFGLAKAIDHRLVEATVFTEHGQVIGTPEYMSPEQAGLDGLDVDTRTDVYSLGVLLYELLTGELPFARAELRRAGYLEMQRILRETEPPKPSTRLTTMGRDAMDMALRRGVDAGELQKRLRGDLDWIVMKAIEKDRTRRYETALELAADLERHLQHLPVLAGKPGVGYRVRKFVRRYRVQVGAAAAVVVALVVGAVGMTLGFLSAQESERREQERQTQVELLTGTALVRMAQDSEQALYPPWPAMVDDMERWLANDLGRPMALKSRISAMASATGSSAPRGGWPADVVSGHDSDRFVHTVLAGLEKELTDLEVLGTSVQERLHWARRLVDVKSRDGARWEAARAAIAAADGVTASALYKAHPIDLVPQVGLVPIGMNPVTKLWEFYELRSACPVGAQKDPAEIPVPEVGDGSIAVGESTGIVFVLVPGGILRMGSDPERDRLTTQDEMSVHEVPLAPFFLARHELTQGQWMRLSRGEQPSNYRPGHKVRGMEAAVDLAHPVELVDWAQCDRLLQRHGLVLPTEAQWEWACRAGTDTPWWTGEAEDSLQGAANVLDLHAQQYAQGWTGAFAAWSDGYLIPAPVGRMRPNRFGLHDVHGNVWEWCRDQYVAYKTHRCRVGDGLRLGDHPFGERIARGGSCGDITAQARSSSRGHWPPSVRYKFLGVRAARELKQD